jgi:hypothetical protein
MPHAALSIPEPGFFNSLLRPKPQGMRGLVYVTDPPVRVSATV